MSLTTKESFKKIFASLDFIQASLRGSGPAADPGSSPEEKKQNRSDKDPAKYRGAAEPTHRPLVNSWPALLISVAALFISTCQLRLNDRNARIGSRAYMGLADALIGEDTTERSSVEGEFERGRAAKLTANPTITVRLRNAGSTPALDASGWCTFYYEEHMPSGEFWKVRPKLAEPFSENVIIKDRTATFRETLPIDARGIQMLHAGVRYLAVYGNFTYWDVFDQKHETSFCRFYTPVYDEMAVCPTGNYMH